MIRPNVTLNPATVAAAAVKNPAPTADGAVVDGIPTTGAAVEDVLGRLEAMRSDDLDWRTGQAFAYVYDAGRSAERVGKQAYTAFLSENGLDPTAFPSLRRLESDVVNMVARHLRGPAETVGSFTSGGTESILCAVKSARDWARAHRPEVSNPTILLPTTAHAAFHKAAAYFGLAKTLVPVDPATFAADPAAMRAAVTADTILMVGSTPSYAHGVIDPITELGQIALEKDILLHVDACVGGFLLPYVKRLGFDVPPIDLSVPGVTSLSVDLHKYAFCPKGASLVLYTRPELRGAQLFACADWTGYTIINPTVQSSKSGGPIAAAWAVLHHIGDDGYLELARGTMAATARLVAAIEATDGLRILGRPDFCMVAAASESADISVFDIIDEMKERGWYVQPQLAYGNSPANIHFSLQPGNVHKVDAMTADLEQSVTAARQLPDRSAAVAGLTGMFAGADSIDDQALAGLLTMVGVDGGQLPDRMAPVNEALNAMPVPMRERILKAFVDGLYR